MLIPKKINDLLNQQIAQEIGASAQYFNIGGAIDAMGYPNIGATYIADGMGELSHAQMMTEFVLKVGGEVKVGEIPKPVSDFKDVKEVIQFTLELEKKVFGMVSNIAAEAVALNDHLTRNFIQQFIDEGVAEIGDLELLIKRFEKHGEQVLYHMDQGNTKTQGQ